ncbi:Bll2215 protein [Polaromonas sp. CG9_12]|nr:Bll2215 protein [Polaromonas sp. CG9_12]
MKNSQAFSHLFLVRLTGWLAAAFMLVAPVPSWALTAAEEQGVRAVVEAQLAALARDDAATAFSFAAPNVRASVGTASRFMDMVRKSYPAIYRPASTAFLQPEEHHGQVIQRVQLMDDDGKAWLALYSVQRQKDNTWRITGCQVIPNKGCMA